ncbi:MAG TPA: hypothetical protein PK926_13940 [Spirochaetota bacterium]|nr:hypothetical protein [Spirochaetota bacterium]HPI88676.1 hypothetical protein [Spirochaetota bacterium]HPR49117.1 hypothetical protein [Spirochaetota bacterium]
MKLFLASLTAMLLLSCGTPLKRAIVPQENRFIDVRKDGAALVRSIPCDVYLEHVSEKGWKKILSLRDYRAEDFAPAVYDIPPVDFYQIIIRNTSRLPLTVENCYVRYETTTVPALDSGRAAVLCSYSSTPPFHVKNLYNPRRFTGEKNSIETINYKTETVRSLIPFIPSEDAVLFFRAFDWIPAETRAFFIVLDIRYGEAQTSVVFTMKEAVYRTRGKHFQEPKQETDDYDFMKSY